MTAPQSRWQITRGCRILWRRWDEEYVVYNTGSADTHALDRVSGEALRCLESGGMTIEELADAVGSRLDCESKEELRSYLRDLVPKLRDLELIEPVGQPGEPADGSGEDRGE